MKLLDQIKQEYAVDKKFSNWKHFCLGANDDMFIKAIDEIALHYASDLAQEKKHNSRRTPIRKAWVKRERPRRKRA